MNSKGFLIIGIVVSFILASMFNIYPLHQTLANMRPMFLIVVLSFWVLYRSPILGVWPVFLVGLICDLLLGTHLGHQAFCAVLMAFVLRLLLLYAKELTLIQAWILATIGIVVYQLSLWVLQAFTHSQFMWTGFESLISSILLFPIIWHPLYWINRQLKERAF